MGSRREKERVIGAVILKVMEWRRLYIQEGITLEKGATLVGISKKSLDDYFLQLRVAQANGFNFNEHKDDKIGIMRYFNKGKPYKSTMKSAADASQKIQNYSIEQPKGKAKIVGDDNVIKGGQQLTVLLSDCEDNKDKVQKDEDMQGEH